MTWPRTWRNARLLRWPWACSPTGWRSDVRTSNQPHPRPRVRRRHRSEPYPAIRSRLPLWEQGAVTPLRNKDPRLASRGLWVRKDKVGLDPAGLRPSLRNP